jgi:hypothetical protein
MQTLRPHEHETHRFDAVRHVVQIDLARQLNA